MADLAGKYLGRYHLAERLGEGGMATVYKAYDTRLERDVAIKIIRSAAFPLEALDGVLKRFEREAKALAKLSHPNIVKVHDYGEHDGSPYLVMEYLPGGTLKKLIGKPINWQDAIRLLLPVARGVVYAHQRGILHRDIKPANILLTESGEPMLSDFGIAKLFEGEQTTALTGSGMAIGTPEYMAPEQWTGTTSPQSDLYSLGVVFYEMLVGRKPYVGDTPASILIKQATEPLPNPRQFVPDLPEALEQILVKVLAKQPGERYTDIHEFIRELERVQRVEPTARVEVPQVKEETPSIKPSVRVSEIAAPQDEEATIREESTPSLQDRAVQKTFMTAKKPSPEEDGRTVHAYQVELQKEDNDLPSSEPVSRDPLPIKLNRKRLGFLVGGIFILIALWLGSSRIGTLFAPEPVATEQATVAFTLTPKTIGETLTPESTPTPVNTLTPTPLPTEITDAKGVVMRLVPAGEFTMGSEKGDDNAQPVHQVYLDTFYMDVYEVTNVLYKACVDAGKCEPPTNSDTYLDPQYTQHPVTYVDWYMAVAYCSWRGVTLPTEAQWEKAARGVDARTYPWGEQIGMSYANYNKNVGGTLVVGSYPKGESPYGIQDMAGNVEEWVFDWYSDDYYAMSPDTNPTGPETGMGRLVRGGAWFLDSTFLTTHDRFGWVPTHASKFTGFRCALHVETETTEPSEPVVTDTATTQITDDKGVEMVLVPAGTFTMGYTSDDAELICQEARDVATCVSSFKQYPTAHQVYLDAYYIDKYEVTNALYAECVKEGLCWPPIDRKSNTRPDYYANPKYANYPVIFVNWGLAKKFCEWRGATLPTNAQWEKAARGEDARPYPWGEEAADCTKANYSGCAGDTVEVGSYETGKSPYGVYDMSGNVDEWVADWSGPHDTSPASNPVGPDSGERRISRGGSWVYSTSGILAFRDQAPYPVFYTHELGFRCALPVPKATQTPEPVISSNTQITDDKGVEMVLVPAGEFIMGSNDGNDDEKPAHRVYLDAFYIDKYEVSNEMYKECVKAGLCNSPANPNSYTHYDYYVDTRYANYPVINVDWLNASNYCEWAGGRLPGEAEWEKAARGMDERLYPWGNIFDGTQANIHDASNYWTFDVMPIDSYPNGVSVYGVFNMVGNVPEWVNDWYDKDYYANSPERNPKGPNNGSLRILRGGPGYFRSTEHLSLTYARLATDPLITWNIPNDPTTYYKYTGFRCAKDANP